MPNVLLKPSLSLPLLALSLLSLSLSLAHAQAAPSILRRDAGNPLNINTGPAPDPEDGPPLSAGALRDTSYLPAQIGAIVGAYAVSLVLVAITLLALSKKRRDHIHGGIDEVDFANPPALLSPVYPSSTLQVEIVSSKPAAPPNFSYPSPIRTQFNEPGPYIYPSPTSTISVLPGVDFSVDQRIVSADRAMAQSQLEDMYKYVMEHDDAKQRGVVLEAPAYPGADANRVSAAPSDKASVKTLSKKERVKPASLNLSATHEEKSKSRTSSLFSALRSPKKKPIKGSDISSPIMTPMSGTFPGSDAQEIPLRHYAPVPPPPIPQAYLGGHAGSVRSMATATAPMTPDISPQSIQSIDERIGLQLPPVNTTNLHHSRNISQAPTEVDPESATTEASQAPLVGLPCSPKPGATFPSLPSSPKPGATFQRSHAPSAIRTGGSLPLRAYEPAMASPSVVQHTTKQTVFERKQPLSPMGARTPGTAGAVPYSPYQPFTPLMPMTPSLVTKDDRKRMRRMVPKTPTLEMVQSADDAW